jgi:hypothetical protein
MCSKCFNGLWCLDEKEQFDKFVCGFSKKKASAPAPVIISTSKPKQAEAKKDEAAE